MADIKWSAFPTAGALTSGDVLVGLRSGANVKFSALTIPWPASTGGTGVANAVGSTITLGGALTLSGLFTTTLTVTGNTALTLPTSGTLATVGGTVSSITGTANQVIASAPTGAVTLSLPQSIGTGSSPSFTGLTAGNLGFVLNTISSTNTNGNIVLTPNGTGAVNLSSANATNQFSFLTQAALAATNVFNFPFASGTVTYTFPAASGTLATVGGTVSSITGTANQVIASNPTGNVTLSLPQSIATSSSPIFSAVQLGTTGIKDVNGNQIIGLNAQATSVNYLSVANAPTGSSVSLSAVGSDPNVSMNLVTAGTGTFILTTAALTTPLRIQSGTSSQHSSFFSFANTAASQTYTFPDATGTLLITGQAISTVPSIAFSSTSGVIGTTTNDNAAAGSVGEFVTSNISESSAVALSTGVTTNITSISLTAGDWDVFGNISFGGATNTIVGFVLGSSSVTSGTLGDSSTYGCLGFGSPGLAIFANSTRTGITIPTARLSLSGTTTVYLVADMLFTVNTGNACGTLSARRRR